MTNESKKPMDEDRTGEQREPSSQPPTDRPPKPDTVDVLENLVYSGGYDRDPQEILGNPAVAPEMLQEGRDLRTDLFREADEADPNSEP